MCAYLRKECTWEHIRCSAVSLQMQISLFCTNISYETIICSNINISCFNSFLISLYTSIPVFPLTLRVHSASPVKWLLCCRLYNCCCISSGLLCTEESYGAILWAIVQALLVNNSHRKRLPLHPRALYSSAKYQSLYNIQPNNLYCFI